MFDVGSIVYHDDLIFKDGSSDSKDRRPCVVIYDDQIDEIIYTMPITSNARQFNKRPYLYTLICQPLYDYKKLSFVKVNDVLENSYYCTHDTGIRLNSTDMIRVLENASKLGDNAEYHSIIYYSLNNLLDTKDEKKEKPFVKKKRPANN